MADAMSKMQGGTMELSALVASLYHAARTDFLI